MPEPLKNGETVFVVYAGVWDERNRCVQLRSNRVLLDNIIDDGGGSVLNKDDVIQLSEGIKQIIKEKEQVKSDR